MQLNLGTKIRELRRRDGRTQDNLAEALGVTAQAVSRWESGSSYPDMEMIPSIANYFHISIDELFGYQDKREETIQNILQMSDKMLSQCAQMYPGSLSEDFYENIRTLRTAAEEFPNEPRILLQLAQALHMWGWSKCGTRMHKDDTSDILEFDVEYNAQNIYWQEAVHVFEKLLKTNPSPEKRETAINHLTQLYCRMGEYDKAKALADNQNSIIVCKEMLLPMATIGEEQAMYQSERVMALLSNLQLAISESVAFRPAVSSSDYGKQNILSVINLYETIFSDGRMGRWHGEVGRLYLHLINYELNGNGNPEKILYYFDKAFDHYTESIRVYNAESYSYSAPLLSGLKPLEKGSFVPTAMGDFWKMELKKYPANILDELRKNPKYAECFK